MFFSNTVKIIQIVIGKEGQTLNSNCVGVRADDFGLKN